MVDTIIFFHLLKFANMFIDTSTVTRNGKSYTRYLLRESYREQGKVKHRTIANLSSCSPEEIEAIRLGLRHKDHLQDMLPQNQSLIIQQGLSFGAVWAIREIAKELGIIDALGNHNQGKLALWQVIARVLDQGSRLSAVRLAQRHAACDILNLEAFNEDDLYSNLEWLHAAQDLIENKMYETLSKNESTTLFLYDVTSTYLEGNENELAFFGYNRDGKKGKKQIVVGLLCNQDGDPLSIEVFTGNTQDTTTFASQVQKVAQRFGGKKVTFVGDRGMIKQRQMENLGLNGFYYITAITKPQIEKMLHEKVFQMDLFDQELAELSTEDGLRYVLRRNPMRVTEIQNSREDKFNSLLKRVEKENQYLANHPKAKTKVALRKIEVRSRQLKIDSWVQLSINDRMILLEHNQDVLDEISKLDGCYALKTNLIDKEVSKEVIHERYKDLALVEWAFRISKSVLLNLRPVYLRNAERTRAHVFIVMMAYRIVKELAKRWKDFDLTVDEGLQELSSICVMNIEIGEKVSFNQIPEPRELSKLLLEAANIRLPDVIQHKGVNVSTKKKLNQRR